MPNEVFKKSRSEITAQASAAITADNYSGGTQTVISQAGSSGNAEGSWEADVYVAVTVAPSGGDATAQVYMEASPDNTNFAAEDHSLTVKIPNGETGYFYAGIVELPNYCKLKLMSEDYGITASLIAVPKLPEVQ